MQYFELIFVVYENDDSINLPLALERVDRKNQQFFDNMNVINEKEWPYGSLYCPWPQVCWFIYIYMANVFKNRFHTAESAF